MKIRNHNDLILQKELLKEAIALQENQMKDNALMNAFSYVKKKASKTKISDYTSSGNSSKIENGVDLILSTLSNQLLKGRVLGAFPKLAIGIGLFLGGKIITKKITERIGSIKK